MLLTINYYAARVADYKPFAFVRYGEGEIKWLVPNLPIKAKRYPSLKHARGALLQTIVQPIENTNYFVAIQHLWHFEELGKLRIVEDWIKANLPDHDWHYAGVFRDATLQANFYPMFKALEQSDLPLVLVGPKRIGKVDEVLPIYHHIVTHPTHAFQQIGELAAQILSIVDPAIFIFACSFAAKVLIHRLFERRQHSFMIDFGSLYDGYVGFDTRPYHKHMTPELIARNLGND
jgi:hypothetical protein